MDLHHISYIHVFKGEHTNSTLTAVKIMCVQITGDVQQQHSMLCPSVYEINQSIKGQLSKTSTLSPSCTDFAWLAEYFQHSVCISENIERHLPKATLCSIISDNEHTNNFCFHVRFTASTKFSFGAIEFAYLALLRRLVPAGKAEVSVLLYCYIKSMLIYKEHYSKSVIFIVVAYSCTLSFFLLILYTMFYLEDK